MKAKQSKTTKKTRTASKRRPLMVITRPPQGEPLDTTKAEAEKLGYDVLVLPYLATAFVLEG